jgi:hypothetical protein
MKTLMNYTVIITTIMVFLGVSTLNAQEWSKDQMEVWQEVENMWEQWKAGNLDAAFANIHEDYLGWNNTSPLPMSKAKWVDPIKETADMYSDLYYDIEAARILVVKDAAVVHYYFNFSSTYDDGEKKKKIKSQGKWTMFYIKHDGNWVCIGDMTVEKK